jgi:death-on-curing protein
MPGGRDLGSQNAELPSQSCDFQRRAALSSPLIDGSKQLALAATIAFLGLNGRRLTLSNDQAYKLIIKVATGELDEVASIADRIRRASQARLR